MSICNQITDVLLTAEVCRLKHLCRYTQTAVPTTPSINVSSINYLVKVSLSGTVLVSINVVALRRAQAWVTVSRLVNHLSI